MGALQHYLTHQDAADDFVSEICRAAVTPERMQKYSQWNLRLNQFLFITYALHKAPQLWLIKNWLGQSKERVPEEVASVSKIAEGFLAVLWAMKTQEKNLVEPVTVEDILTFSRVHEMQIGPLEICPASNEMIAGFLCNLTGTNNRAIHKSKKELSTVEACLKLADLSWSAEETAVKYAYTRLRYLKQRNPGMTLSSYLRFTHPLADVVYELAKGDGLFDNSTLAPLDAYAQSMNPIFQPTRQGWKKFDKLCFARFQELEAGFSSLFKLERDLESVLTREIWEVVLGETPEN